MWTCRHRAPDTFSWQRRGLRSLLHYHWKTEHSEKEVTKKKRRREELKKKKRGGLVSYLAAVAKKLDSQLEGVATEEKKSEGREIAIFKSPRLAVDRRGPFTTLLDTLILQREKE
uniref:Uncharacterized protein n=1 Tax=Solanum tuberosum TaxID=4113 RepID=M1D8H8_SOLTU